MREESVFEIALVGFLSEGEKVEVVRIFENLLSEIGLRPRESRLEIGDCLPLAAEEPALDLHYEDVPAPAIPDGLLRIPKPLLSGPHEVQKPDVVTPGQLCNRLLHNWPSFGKGPHIFEIPRRKPSHFWEFYVEILRQPLNDFRPQPSASCRVRISFPICQ